MNKDKMENTGQGP